MRLVSRNRRHSTHSHRALAWRRGAVALLWPIGALCQPSPDVAGAGQALEEIIVTARKVEEDAYSIPMSVQALSGDFVDESDLSSLYEMQFDVPGLVVVNLGMFGAGISLRGVTDQGGGSLAIAPHFNGVYLGASRLALARMFDVERGYPVNYETGFGLVF
jgi:iron complex outermembrane receptor protein